MREELEGNVSRALLHVHLVLRLFLGICSWLLRDKGHWEGSPEL